MDFCVKVWVQKNTVPRGKNNQITLDINSVVVLDILKEVDYNWFAFVVVLEEHFTARNYSSQVLDQFLCDFASQLDNLGIPEGEMRLTEQSRVAYLDELRQKEARLNELTEENIEEESYLNIDPETIKTKLNRMKDKW